MSNIVRILSIVACVAAMAATWFAYEVSHAYLNGYVASLTAEHAAERACLASVNGPQGLCYHTVNGVRVAVKP